MGKKRIQHQITLEIDSTPNLTPTWLVVKGLENVSEALNEVVQQFQFFDKNGYSESEVTGQAPVTTLTLKRDLEDQAQNYILSKKYSVGEDRKTNMRMLVPQDNGNVTTIVVPVTIATIMDVDGASTDVSNFSVVLHYNDRPTITNGDTIEYLAVTSTPGSLSGDTEIKVNPTIEGGNIYKYQVAANVSQPVIDQDLSALTTWNGTDEITATTGQQILIAETTAAGLAKKFGIAVVTSA